MKNNKTHITVLLDRSGSMEQIRGETIDGFNALLNEQQQQTDAADLTLVQFDAEDPFEIIHRSLPLAQVPRLSWETYVPRSGTPLLDAIGCGIRNIEKTLSKSSDSAHPDKIIVAIITDGQENSSRRYNKKKVSQMIEKKQGVGWQFAFLSADMASINDALDYGINPHSTMSYDKTHQGTTMAWNSISSAISSYRQGRSRDVSFLDEAKSSSGSTPVLNSLRNN